MNEKNLFCYGFGYSAKALADLLLPQGWAISGTTRNRDSAEAMAARGVTPILLPGGSAEEALKRAQYVLISAGPDAEGDPALRQLEPAIRQEAARLRWLGYLSTTGVYGDHQGGWVDETTPLAPTTRRGRWRVGAETAWQRLALGCALPLHIFRLAGIYGPGRGPFEKVKAGTARRIIKPGQVFSRIHVEDIAGALARSMNAPSSGAIYNLCDDSPAPPQDVIAHAAALLGVPAPPQVAWEDAELTPMARSFYGESKRVHNERMKRDLGYALKYPDYRAGLAGVLAAEAVDAKTADKSDGGA